MELVFGVEISFVLMFVAVGLPSQSTIITMSVFISTHKFIISAFFFSLSIKLIVSETSIVGHIISSVYTSRCFSSIVGKISLVVGTVLENVGASAMSPTVLEVAQIDAAIRFVHATKTMRTGTALVKITDIGVCVKTTSDGVGLRVDLCIEEL